MPRKFDESTIDDLETARLRARKRDASIARYNAVHGELAKHRADAEKHQRAIDILTDGLPEVARGHARAKFKPSLPWS